MGAAGRGTCPADVNDDCTIDGADLAYFLSNWSERAVSIELPWTKPRDRIPRLS